MPTNDDNKTLEQLQAELSKAQEEIKKRDSKIATLESANHDLEVKNETLHELALHSVVKSGNKKLMEDFE